ncbi:flagellar basal-body rod protein FlgF [Phreatobacter sp.]|uniref:flagellar basal-body rod protein FlgF n=1 Tax=Phreatobacter sp. TaxID=1966341 RepID=UPI003F6F847E
MENIGLVGLSRQVALQRELDVIANNLANLNTTGFKQDNLLFQEYMMPVAREDSFQRGADRRLSFVWDRATVPNMAQGAMQQTGNSLDMAIGGRGFFVVQTPEGERYTRNGSFEINAQGQLVTKQGHLVLGEGGPIAFEQNDIGITVGRDGSVAASGGLRGRLRIVTADGAGAFEKAGDNLFRMAQGVAARPAEARDVRQGFIEKSNVEPVLALSRMIEVTRAYQSLATSMERHDQLRREAIRSLGNASA